MQIRQYCTLNKPQKSFCKIAGGLYYSFYTMTTVAWKNSIHLLYTAIRRGELDSAGSGKSPVVGFCEHGDEPSGSIKEQDIF
jgi:hypothetical protein